MDDLDAVVELSITFSQRESMFLISITIFDPQNTGPEIKRFIESRHLQTIIRG